MKERQQSFKNMEEYIKFEMGGGYYGCITLAKEVLNRTGHIPTVTNIARGAGYCTYYARLSETIGIRSFFNYAIDHYSGKGKSIHKILALASIELFPGKPNEIQLKDTIKRVINENENQFSHDKEFSENKDALAEQAFFLLNTLISNLDLICKKLDVKKEELFPIVEQQIMDYDLHIRGIPDLILESQSKKRAIVVEWKTYGESEMQYEEAQAIAYSLLEASRLGISDPRQAIIGVPKGNTGVVDVIPVVIKANIHSQLGPHPFIREDYSIESLREYTYLVDDVMLEAEHLTTLLANANSFIQGKTNICDIKKTWNGKELKVNVLRLTPGQLWKGQPKKQEKWPCRTKTGKPFCNLMEPCKFYFGKEVYTQDSVDKDMWLLRFKVFESKENSLVIYRAIYDIFKIFKDSPFETDAFTHFSNGGGFYYSPGDFPIKKEGIPQVIIASEGRFRVECLDEIKIVENPNSTQLICIRKLRDFEKDEHITFVIPNGRTALLTLSDSWNPLLSTSVFIKISNINSSENQIEYVLEVPSTILDFQMYLFMKYLRKNTSHGKFMLFEVGVDLTQMELNSIHSLQKSIKEVSSDDKTFYLDKDEIVTESRLEEKLLDKEEKIDEEEDTDPEIEGVMEVLRQLIKRSSERR